MYIKRSLTPLSTEASTPIPLNARVPSERTETNLILHHSTEDVKPKGGGGEVQHRGGIHY